mmetsp:Transcript_32235/g.102237  ORF Transcript_32235/g.102237 Transcript_32235/m.102237 type:complete len:303 (+) Transcript_32235:135-1043(+)
MEHVLRRVHDHLDSQFVDDVGALSTRLGAQHPGLAQLLTVLRSYDDKRHALQLAQRNTKQACGLKQQQHATSESAPELVSKETSFLHTAHHVGRHRIFDFLRVRQVQLGHQFGKLLLRLRHPRVELLLLVHRRHVPPLVVVAGVDEGPARESENFAVDALVQNSCITLLKICPAATPNKQGVPGEGHAGGARQVVRQASVGVPRRGEHLQRQVAKRHLVALLDLDVRIGPGGLGNHGLHLRHVLAHRPARCDVVRMGVRVDNVLQLKAKLFQRDQVSLLLLQNWVDKHSLLRRGAAQDVGEG